MTAEFDRKKVTCLKRIGLQHRGGKRRKEVLLLGNDKNNVIINYLSKGLSKVNDK